MSGATVTRINGAPGCGKTTQLLDEVENHRDAGMKLGDMFYLTFSKTSQQEVSDRLLDVYPEENRDDVRKSAKTVHGAACTSALMGGCYPRSRQADHPNGHCRRSIPSVLR